MRFIKSTALTFVSNGLVFALSLLSAMLISRLLGPSGRGAVDVSTNFLTFAILIIGWGLPVSNVFVIGREKEGLPAVLGNNLLLTLPTFLILIPLYYLNRHFQFQFLRGISDFQFFLTLLTIPFMNLKTSIISMFLGLQDMVEYNRFNVIDKTLNLVILAAFLFWGPEPTSALLAALLASIFLSLGTTLRLMSRHQLRPQWDLRILKRLLSYGSQAIIGNTIQKLNYRLDLFILNYYLPLSQVGIYGAAVVLAETLWGVSGSIATVMFPLAAASGETKEMHRFTNQVTRISFTLITGISLVLALLSKPLILLLFGEGFYPAIAALLWLLPGVTVFSVSNILANFLAGSGLQTRNTYSAIIASIVTIVLDLLLIPRIGIIGASLATSLSYLTFTLTTLIFYTHYTKSHWVEVMVLRKEDLRLLLNFASRFKRT